jgi:thioredoxin-dependent peroxiredoxin
MKLMEGDKAPFFKGFNQDGKWISLDDFKGKKLILYFYPKDNTPGCTAESCDLSDHYSFWIEKGYDVVGISPDSVTSHKKFAEKYDFRFNLIADPEKEILKAYGVWGEKKMYGRTTLGVLRTTFLLNEAGIIEKIVDKVKTREHSGQIIGLINL